MSMIGIPLATYREELQHISPGVLPTRTITNYLERLAPYEEQMSALQYQYRSFDPFRHCAQFPDEFYHALNFEELCKVYGSSLYELTYPFREKFDKEPEFAIVRKIKSSLWRYGSPADDTEWNTIVDAYNGIRNFSFGLDGFEIRLNYTRGFSAYSITEFDPDVYLDGVFGFVVHYRGEPVMTIGFSFAKGRRLLLSQVQLKKRKGNRFLYTLPSDRVEFVVGLMKKYFPKFILYLVDGSTLADLYLSEYRKSLTPELTRETPRDERVAKTKAKIFGLEGVIGEQIRRTYRLTNGPWRLSPHRPFFIFQRKYFRVVRA